jgi:chaperonin cofactor prefoldin
MDRFLAHVEAQKAKIRRQIARLEEELGKLDYSERVYRESGAQIVLPVREEPFVDRETLVPNQETYNHRITIKDRIISILRTRPDGLTSSQLLECLRSAGAPDISRRSLAPKLTRLKSEEALELAYGLWRVKKHENGGA